jgi:GGDEF domain-containing protein
MGNSAYIYDMFGYDEGDKLLKYIEVKMKEFIGERGECSRVFADLFMLVFLMRVIL